MSTQAIIDLCVAWGPTILIALMLLSGLMWGFIRGFRKSLILSIQALVAFGICVAFYFILVGLPALDKDMLEVTNYILGMVNGSSLQQLLGVSQSRETITEILIEFIPKNAGSFEQSFRLILTDNGAYLATLVSLAYHIILAFLLMFVYVILLFLFYIIYLIFYPERRHKRKLKKKYNQGLSEKPYRKRKLLGGVVGILRKSVTAVVFLSFVGGIFFIVAGTGDKELAEYDFKDDNMNLAYGAYSSISKYGQNGVFKVLNAIKDPNDQPYYLFAADLVFSGGLNDTEKNIYENVVFREEFAAYLGFAEDTLNLLLKYDDEGVLADYISNPNSDSETIDNVLKIMSKPGFDSEFKALIDEFDAKTYFVNLSLSLVDSLAKNIDQLDVIEDEQVLNILKIIFVNEDCIKASDLLSSDDARGLATLAVDVISNQFADGEMDDTEKILYYLESVLPELSSLSMFNDTAKKTKMNVMMSHLYDYAKDNVSFTGDTSLTAYPSDGSYTANLGFMLEEANISDINSVDWMGELGSLVNVGAKGVKIYRNSYDPNESNVLLTLDKLFDGAKGSENEQAYDEIVDEVASSQLLGAFLSFDIVYQKIEEALTGVAGDFELPHNIEYTNKLKSDGTVEKYGDVYYVLKSVKALVKNDGLTVINNYVENSSSMSTSETLDFAKDLANVLLKDVEPGSSSSVVDLLLGSDLLKYTLTGVLTGLDTGNFEIYVPDNCMVVGTTYNDKDYKYISTSEIKNVFKELPDMVDLIKPALDSTDDINVAELIKNTNLTDILSSSVILEGTVSNIAKDSLNGQEQVIIPSQYADVAAWLSVRDENGNVTSDGEIVKIIKGIQAADLDFDKISGGSFEVNDLKGISDTKISKLINSDILYYTFSNVISSVELEGAVIIIPNSSLDSSAAVNNLSNNALIVPINRSEISGLVSTALKIIPASDEKLDLREIYNSLDEVLDEDILQATIINLLVTKLDSNASVVIPQIYKDQANETYLKTNYASSIWVTSNETKHVFDSLDELVNVTSNPNPVEIKTVTNELDVDTLKIEKSSISTILSSVIICATVSKKVIEQEALSVPTNVIDNTYSDISLITGIELDKLLNTTINLLGELPAGFDPASDIEAGKTEADYYELSINSLTDPNLMDNISIRESQVDELCTSKILSATISANIIDNSAIVTPINVTEDATYVGGTLSKEIEAVELKKTLIAAVELVGTIPVGKIEAEINVNELKSLDTDEIVLTASKITTICTSVVLSATVSDKLVTNAEIKTPVAVVDSTITQKYNGNAITVIETTELSQTLNVALELMGTKVDEVLQIKVSELSSLDTDTITLTSSKTERLCTSQILSATVSNKMIASEELVTPLDACEDVNILSAGIVKEIKNTELEATLKAAISILGTGVGDAKALSVGSLSSFDTNTIILDSTKVDEICASDILSATVSDKLTSNASLVTPINVTEAIAVYNNANPVRIIDSLNLNDTLNAAIQLLGTAGSVELSKLSDLDPDTIVLTSAKIDIIANNTILTATVSKNVFDAKDSSNNPALIIPNSTVDSTLVQDYQSNSINVLKSSDLDNVLEALLNLTGTEIDAVLSVSVGSLSNLNTSDIYIDSAKVDDMTSSSILTATISDKLITSGALIIPDVVISADLIKNYLNTSITSLTPAELNGTLKSLLVMLGAPEVKIDDIENVNVDDLVLTPAKIDTIVLNNVLRCTVSDKLYGNDLIIPKAVIDSTLVKDYTDATIYVVDAIELQTMFNVTFELLGSSSEKVSDLANLDCDSIEIDSARIDSICTSIILMASVSDSIHTNVSFKVPRSTIDVTDGYTTNYNNTSTIYIINETELNLMLNGAITLIGSPSITVGLASSIDVDSLLLTEAKIDAATASDILIATLSEKIISNKSNIIINGDLVSTEKEHTNVNNIDILDGEELNKLLKAIVVGLGISAVSNIQGITASDIKIPSSEYREMFAQSEVMRATTTANVVSSDYLYVQKASSCVNTFTDVDSNTRMVFTDIEIVNMLNAIEFFTDGDELTVNFDLSTLLAKAANKSGLESALQSNVIRIKVSSVLNYAYSNGLYDVAKVDALALAGTVINSSYEVINYLASNPLATYSLIYNTTSYNFNAPTSVACYKFGKSGEDGFVEANANILTIDDITAFIWAYKAFIA